MGLRERISTFLCRDEDERRWMLDMHVRLLPVTRTAGIIGVLTVASIVPWTNPLALLPVLVASIAMAAVVATTAARGDVRPILPAVMVLQGSIALAIVMNDRAGVGDLFLLTTAIVPAAGGFPGRVVTLLAAYCGALMIAVAAVTGAAAASPPVLILPLLTLVSMTILATAVRHASIEHRQEAAVDDLTGALNRRSLAARAEELQQQTAMTGEPVAVLAADIDDFKHVNDRHGHQAGDRVLVALARMLRTRAGVGGQAYRLGGDEFVLLLPGATALEAGLVAEEVLRASRAEPLGGVPVTVSVGVAASMSGTTFSFDEVFAAADAALYEAKHGGRDAVRIAAGRALAA